MQRLQDQLNDARIVAPFDGVILSITLVEGKQVQAYNEVLILADPTDLEISADLQDSEMSEMSEGMPLIAEFINRPGEQLNGIVRRLPYPYSGGGLSDATATMTTSRCALPWMIWILKSIIMILAIVCGLLLN